MKEASGDYPDKDLEEGRILRYAKWSRRLKTEKVRFGHWQVNHQWPWRASWIRKVCAWGKGLQKKGWGWGERRGSKHGIFAWEIWHWERGSAWEPKGTSTKRLMHVWRWRQKSQGKWMKVSKGQLIEQGAWVTSPRKKWDRKHRELSGLGKKDHFLIHWGKENKALEMCN